MSPIAGMLNQGLSSVLFRSYTCYIILCGPNVGGALYSIKRQDLPYKPSSPAAAILAHLSLPETRDMLLAGLLS
jgi:hypothetical protein